MAPAIILPTSYGPWLGAYLIGSMISAIFFGILCLQCYLFYKRSDEVPRSVTAKCLVASIWVINTFHLFCSIWSCYWFMVTNFTNPYAIFGTTPWSSVLIYLCSALSNGITQGWFTRRIWFMTGKNKVITIPLAIGVAATCSLQIALTGKIFALLQFQSFSDVDWLLYLSDGVDAATNLGLTVVLCVLLSRRRRSPLYRADYLVTVPVVYMAHTGIFCLIEIFIAVILRATRRQDFIFFGAYIPYSMVYAMSLLGFLNNSEAFGDTPRAPGLHIKNLSAAQQDSNTQHIIRADIQRALDDENAESIAAADVPVAVHVEKTVEKSKVHW